MKVLGTLAVFVALLSSGVDADTTVVKKDAT